MHGEVEIWPILSLGAIQAWSPDLQEACQLPCLVSAWPCLLSGCWRDCGPIRDKAVFQASIVGTKRWLHPTPAFSSVLMTSHLCCQSAFVFMCVHAKNPYLYRLAHSHMSITEFPHWWQLLFFKWWLWVLTLLSSMWYFHNFLMTLGVHRVS